MISHQDMEVLSMRELDMQGGEGELMNMKNLWP